MASGRIALALRTDRLTRLRIEWARRNRRLIGQMGGVNGWPVAPGQPLATRQGCYAGGFAGYFLAASQHVADTVASALFICSTKSG